MKFERRLITFKRKQAHLFLNSAVIYRVELETNMYILSLLVGLKQYLTERYCVEKKMKSLSILMQQGEMNHTQIFFHWNIKYILSSLPKLSNVLICTVAGERP